MPAIRSSFTALPLILFMLSASGCTSLSPPGLTNVDREIIEVSTSPYQWQKDRGPYFSASEEAVEYVEMLELSGHDDWRLPTPEEMMDFYYAFDFGSAKASELGITIEGYYWVRGDDGAVYAGSWCDGEICEISRSYRPSPRGGFVRAVRP